MSFADFCAIVISALSLIISLYNAIAPNLSKISVSIRFIRKYKDHEMGRSFDPSCYIILNNFSKQTKYIQSVYIYYKFSKKSVYDATFIISDEIFSMEPQQIVKLPVFPPKDVFCGDPHYTTKVYAAVIDSSGKTWESQDFITIGYLHTLYTYMHNLS